jgi:hypothetical protein
MVVCAKGSDYDDYNGGKYASRIRVHSSRAEKTTISMFGAPFRKSESKYRRIAIDHSLLCSRSNTNGLIDKCIFPYTARPPIPVCFSSRASYVFV